MTLFTKINNKITNKIEFAILQKCGVANTEVTEWVTEEAQASNKSVIMALLKLNKMATKLAKTIKVFKDEDGWYHTYDTNNNIEGFCHHYAEDAQYFEALERVYFKYFYKTIV